jgi:hypothetical protein
MLETVAEQDRAHLGDLVAAFASESRDLDAAPEPRRAAAAARAVARRAPWAADVVEEWVADLDERLRAGMNGQAFRALAGTGAELLKTGFALAELADRLWARAEALGADAAEAVAGRRAVAEATRRLLAAKPRVEKFARLADRHPPEPDPAALDRGLESARQGHFLTPDQARQAVRKTG